MTKKVKNMTQAKDFLSSVPDDELEKISFAMPWQYDVDEKSYKDGDGFTNSSGGALSRNELQDECWDKFHRNPQINTAVRGKVGRIAGWGFETTSGIEEIQDFIEEIEEDPRNRLYNFYPKYICRADIEGELYLCATLHKDGFIEIDFIDPSTICSKGHDGSGIIFHPTKPTFPLFYNIEFENIKGQKKEEQIPSIFIARYPELINIAKQHGDFDSKKQTNSKNRSNVFNVFGGYNRFIISWDKSFITRRSVSYLRTTLEWLNHYENLKKYEIDHKKSSGAYLWIFKITDAKTFKSWLSLTDAERRKTGIMAKKTPGGSIILPPGIELEVKNPNLTSIKDQDTDVLHMITSGLDEPEDVSTGKSGGTYASVKASRGPMSDRMSDEIAYFDRFFKFDFWGNLFYLRSKLTDFPEFFTISECVGFKYTGKDADGNPKHEEIMKDKKKRPEKLIDITYPVSEMIDMETRARALLGVKHGPVSETLGVPNEQVAKRIGFGGYSRARLRKATEDRMYPKLIYAVDAETLQEKMEGEKPKPKDKSDVKKKEKK